MREQSAARRRTHLRGARALRRGGQPNDRDRGKYRCPCSKDTFAPVRASPRMLPDRHGEVRMRSVSPVPQFQRIGELSRTMRWCAWASLAKAAEEFTAGPARREKCPWPPAPQTLRRVSSGRAWRTGPSGPGRSSARVRRREQCENSYGCSYYHRAAGSRPRESRCSSCALGSTTLPEKLQGLARWATVQDGMHLADTVAGANASARLSRSSNAPRRTGSSPTPTCADVFTELPKGRGRSFRRLGARSPDVNSGEGKRLYQCGPGDVIEPWAAFSEHLASTTAIARNRCRAMVLMPTRRELLEWDDNALTLRLFAFLIRNQSSRIALFRQTQARS